MRFFKCSVCNVFFENYGKATIHLALKHSDSLVSSVVGSKTAATTANRGKDKTGIGTSSLIVPVRFPNVYVVLRRQVADQVLATRKSLINKHGTLKNRQKVLEGRNVSRSNLRNDLKNSKSGSSPVEIKLDDMTASEIEGLIGGLAKKSAGIGKSKAEDTKRKINETTKFKSKSSIPSKHIAPKKVADHTNTRSTLRVATRSSSTTNKPLQNPAIPVHKKNYKQSTTEIKLDSLKASEIELLMNGLFSSKNKSSSNKSTAVLKANSKEQVVFSREEKVSEVDSNPAQDDENANFRRSSRQRKPVSRLVELDDDFVAEEWAGLNSDNDNEDDEYVPESEKKPTKRAAATKRPVNNRSSSSSSDDEQLDTDYELNDEDIPSLKRYDDDNDAMVSKKFKTGEDSEEEFPPLLQRYDEADSQERGDFPKLQPYVRDRRKNKSKPQYKLQCRYCPAQFSAKTWFGNHMREQHANASGKFSCNICPTGKEYTLRFLHKHFRRYHNIKDVEEQKKWEYTCKICGKKNQTLFAHESHERYHKRFMNPENPFPCPVCPHRFSTKFNLTQHFNIHLENNPFQCTFPGCGKKFAGNYHLKRHYSYHIYRTVYKCQHCAATYTRPHRLEDHIRQVHSSAFADPKSKVRQPSRRRKYAIKSLNIGFGSIKDVMNNSNDPDNQNPEYVNYEAVAAIKNEPEPAVAGGSTEQIPQIQGTFSLDISQLPRHSNNVVSSDPVFIKLTQDNPELIDQLLPKAYAGNGGVFKCHLCGWIGSRTYHLQQHLLKEHNKTLEPASTPSEKNPLGISLYCGTCGFRAGTSEEITQHMISSHPEMNKVQCSYCTLRFRTARRKSEHERKCHFSTPKFSCEKCTMTFVTQKGFKNHMYLKHTNPSVRYTCKTCGNVYLTKPAYRRHMDSHLPPDKRRFPSEQPSKCRLCHQVLATKSTLRRHIQYVHLKAKNKWNEEVQRKRQQRKLELLQSTSSTSSTKSNNPDKPAENMGAVAGTSFDVQEPIEEINEILGF